jgi:hypothetical protein
MIQKSSLIFQVAFLVMVSTLPHKNFSNISSYLSVWCQMHLFVNFISSCFNL